MAFGGILVRAIWAVIGTSLSGDLSKCNTTYPIIVDRFWIIDTRGGRIFDRICGLQPERSQGVSKGPPFGLLGLFQRHEVLRFEKSPNRLWLFCEEKAAGAERPIVGDGIDDVSVSRSSR